MDGVDMRQIARQKSRQVDGAAGAATLDLLAARLDALAHEHARLIAELAALKEGNGAPAIQRTDGADGIGVSDDGSVAIHVTGADGVIGVRIVTERGPGIRITSSGTGLQIESMRGGVYVMSEAGPAVYAETTGADAVIASSLGAHGAGLHALGGGVRGGAGTSPRPCGVFAEGGSGDGVYATGEDAAVRGVSVTGYGAVLAGGAAPLRLVPSDTAGAPHTGAHVPGTLVVDAHATLWLCVDKGTPGVWKRIVVQ